LAAAEQQNRPSRQLQNQILAIFVMEELKLELDEAYLLSRPV
jgi:hypothetical protein